MLLEQVLRQIVFEFFALNFEVFTKSRYDASFRFLCTGIKRRNYCCRRGSKLWKNIFIKSIVKKGSPPLDPPLTHLVTVGTEIAAPHKQQVTVAAVLLRFHYNQSEHRL